MPCLPRPLSLPLSLRCVAPPCPGPFTATTKATITSGSGSPRIPKTCRRKWSTAASTIIPRRVRGCVRSRCSKARSRTAARVSHRWDGCVWCSPRTCASSWRSVMMPGSTARPSTNTARTRIATRTMCAAPVTCSRMRPVSPSRRSTSCASAKASSVSPPWRPRRSSGVRATPRCYCAPSWSSIASSSSTRASCSSPK